MKLTKLVMSLLTMLLSIGVMNAQVTTSAMSGSVKTSDGKPAVGVRVKAIHEPTGTQYSVVTRKGGRFDIGNMNTGGPYTVTFSGGDAKDIVKTDIYLTLGETESVDATYQTEEIRVVGTRTTIKTKTGTTSNFGARIINTVPNISRSITNVASLTPQAGGGNSFGGRDGRYNNTQIDGANFNNNFGLRSDPLPGGSSQPISLDAIDEISVNVSPFDVRQSNFTGAGLNATTKKGTNKLTASIFTFQRNQGLIGREAVGQKIPPLVNSATKIYGGRVGGAIIKNKLFFFINGEFETRNAPGITWIPTKNGVVNGSNTSRAHADSLGKLSNFLRTRYGYETGKFDNFDNFEVQNWKAVARLDWNINKQHAASLRYNRYNNIDDQQLNGTSNPFSALPNNRFGFNALSFQNSNYGFENNLESLAFELKSNFNSSFNNQFVATYTKANDGRTSDSKLFPFIDIMNGAPGAPISSINTDNIMSAGYELFTYKNNVENNTLNINNNITYNTGKHSITAGAGFEKIFVNNSFYRFGTSYYRFNSLDAFLNDSTPTAFSMTFPSVPGKEAVELNFGQASLYAQDEIKVNDNFKLSLGLRVDRPLFLNDLTSNPTVDAINLKDLNGNTINFKTGAWPKERNYYSPRIGFNWDVDGNKKKIIRGGAGVFTGRFPFVWFTNQPSNSYTVVKQVSLTLNSTGAAGTYLPGAYKFNANPNFYLPTLQALPSTAAITNLATVDPNFRMPQVFRMSAGYDQKITDKWTLTFDAIYNKDINNLLQYNANQGQPIGKMFGADNRPVYSSTTRRINAGLTDAMVLTNTKKGFGLIFTAQVAKRFSNNWDFSVAYTHTIGMDVSGNPGATANSAWNVIPTTAGNNTLPLAFNDFATKHRIIAYGSYKVNFAKFFATTFSLVYTGYTQGQISYSYSNDANADGQSTNDLLFVPADASQITFVSNTTGGVTYTPQQQSDAFFAYVNQDKYLSKRKGQYAERNGANMPFFSNLDLRILQDILPFNANKKTGIQLSIEVENFTNMINSDWGVSKRVANSRLLQVASAGTLTTAPTFRLNTVNNALPTKSYLSNITAGNVWRCNLGIRLNF